jgi:two-component system phosphate regulon sensor histidine kinase PhoR
MKNRTLRWIALLSSLIIISIIGVQIFWINKEYKLSEERFNQQVIDALNSVINEIKRINKDQSVIEEPVKKVRNNYFIALVNDTVHPFWLENALKREFLKRNLTLDFEYMIYDCFTDSLIFGNFIQLSNDQQTDIKEYTDTIHWISNWHYFAIYFPKKREFLLSEMGIWMVSTMILLILLSLYSYALFIFFKEKQLSDIKNDFISNMTHELKTPISTIILSSDVLRKEIDEQNKNLKTYAEIIYNESKRLKNLIDNVLKTSLIDKAPEIKMEEVSIHQLIQTVYESFHPIIAQKGGTIHLLLNATEDKIIGDPIHLQNVFTNLIDNAIKYADKTPEIEIRTKNHNKNIIVEVIDNGPGIPEEYQSLIFDKFFRIPQGNVHNIKGFGLGLYYVKTILKAMGGEIKLESKLHKGSKFILTLPLIKITK